jgi:hypothetical protein
MLHPQLGDEAVNTRKRRERREQDLLFELEMTAGFGLKLFQNSSRL